MKRTKGRMALVGACLSLVACGNLLDTGFNWDRPGHSPSMTTLGFQGLGTQGSKIRPGASKNVFVTSKMGLVQKKALAFVETVEDMDGSNRTFLQSAPVSSMVAPVHVKWRGQFGNGGAMKVVLGYLGQPFVTMRFVDGDIFVGDAKTGNYVPGDHHTIAVVLDPDGQSYRVSFAGDPHYEQTEISGSAPPPNGKAGEQVIADFGIESVGQERLVYVLDDVRMSHREDI